MASRRYRAKKRKVKDDAEEVKSDADLKSDAEVMMVVVVPSGYTKRRQSAMNFPVEPDFSTWEEVAGVSMAKHQRRGSLACILDDLVLSIDPVAPPPPKAAITLLPLSMRSLSSQASLSSSFVSIGEGMHDDCDHEDRCHSQQYCRSMTSAALHDTMLYTNNYNKNDDSNNEDSNNSDNDKNVSNDKSPIMTTLSDDERPLHSVYY